MYTENQRTKILELESVLKEIDELILKQENLNNYQKLIRVRKKLESIIVDGWE